MYPGPGNHQLRCKWKPTTYNLLEEEQQHGGRIFSGERWGLLSRPWGNMGWYLCPLGRKRGLLGRHWGTSMQTTEETYPLAIYLTSFAQFCPIICWTNYVFGSLSMQLRTSIQRYDAIIALDKALLSVMEFSFSVCRQPKRQCGLAPTPYHPLPPPQKCTTY